MESARSLCLRVPLMTSILVTDTFLSVPRVFAYEILMSASTVFNLNNEGENCQNLKAGFFKNNMGWRLFHLSKKKNVPPIWKHIFVYADESENYPNCQSESRMLTQHVLVFIRLLLSR